MVASIFYVLLSSFFRSNNSAKIVTYFCYHNKIVAFYAIVLYVIKHVLCICLIIK